MNYLFTKVMNRVNKRGYYSKHIAEVTFHNIQYREIKNVDDYINLEKEIWSVVKDNRAQFLIDAENLKDQSIEEKDKSMIINFSLSASLVFGVTSLVMGTLFGTIAGIVSFFRIYILDIAICMFAVFLLVETTNDILKFRNRKIIFYETICQIIRGGSSRCG